MFGLFDTCVHIALLRGAIALGDVLAETRVGPIRLSPVVACELLRGTRGRARRSVERLVASLVPAEPPSWGARFLEAGRLLPLVFPDHEDIGLGRLQNDVLIALTARHTGASVVTFDRHFLTLRRQVPFALHVLEP